MILLVSASFVGCIEDLSEEISSEDDTAQDETITPVGNNNATNMAPYVDAGVWNEHDVHFYLDEMEETTQLGVFVNWAAKDFDGTIESAGFDLDLDMVIDVPVETDFGVLLNQTGNVYEQTLILNNDNWEADIFNGSDGYCGFIFHTTFAFIAVDNAGASSIELVQFVVPEVIEGGEIMEILDEESGLLGITEDHLEMLNNTGCGGGNNYYSGVPIATFFVSQDSANVYHVEVIKVSKQEDLTGFSFFLQDGSGSTYVGGNGFGEIAMQFQGGEEMGIDMAYSGDDEQLSNRATNVSDDDGSEFPVHFSDNDFNGMLSPGDQFLVYGPDPGPAEDGWKLVIQFDATGDIVGSVRMM